MTLNTVSMRSLCSTLVLAVAILVTLHFHVCLGHRLLDRSQNIADVIHGELREDVTCRSFGFGPNCTAHEECAACFLKIPHWEFCVSNKTASHLPTFLFNCTSDPPAPQPQASCHDLSEEECQLDKEECTWCTAMAVASKCYTKDEAEHLPTAVFKCDTEGPSSATTMTRTATKDPVKPF
ncbi:hypothetical protein M9434_002269 [Picochlorum sp. BPE23]|nr:hypothetical protein M9434_002269 [Picochlorum sp. BPE23]